MIRVLVQPAVSMIGTAVTIYEQPGESEDYRGPRRILRLCGTEDGHGTASGSRWDEVRPLEQFEPTLVLEDDFLRPLCDALVRHFSGTEDTRSLRRDYDDERKRTDLLIGHLAAIAKSLSEPQP